MSKPRSLRWYGTEDGFVGWPDCDKCIDYMHTPGLAEACASVGIEHGKSTGEMLRISVEEFHKRRHKERAK